MAETTASLVCPKCAGELRSYERNGVTIDQCGNCRGIFLDRGELERLIDAESASLQTPTPATTGQPAGLPPGYGQPGYGPPRYEQPYRGAHHGGGKHGGEGDRRRRGFLGELFD